MDELEQVQRWMQAVITHTGGVVDGLQSEDARRLRDVSPENVESVIERSRALTATERLSVYSNAYFARLLECLRGEFPVMAEALGEDIFDLFAFGYLQVHPSRTYTLGRLGAHFADYLANTRPNTGTQTREADDWPEFLIDLARLEWTINEVFEGPGAEQQVPLENDQLLAIPPTRWPDATLVPVPCLRLLELDYAVNRYYTAVRKKATPTPPRRERSWVAVTRRDYVVRRYDLSSEQYELLSAIIGGETVGEAILRAARVCADDLDRLHDGVGEWFRSWTADGFFRSVEITD